MCWDLRVLRQGSGFYEILTFWILDWGSELLNGRFRDCRVQTLGSDFVLVLSMLFGTELLLDFYLGWEFWSVFRVSEFWESRLVTGCYWTLRSFMILL